MTYRIVGFGLDAVSYLSPDLGSAANLARKMQNEGVTDVHVFNAAGEEVSQNQLNVTLQEWRERNGWKKPTL